MDSPRTVVHWSDFLCPFCIGRKMVFKARKNELIRYKTVTPVALRT